MSVFNKVLEATEAWLDSQIYKARSTAADDSQERKSLVDLHYPDEQQYGYKERTGLVGPGVLKNMARKDSVVMAIINTRISQITPFLKPQKDKYSPGWEIQPNEPADISPEDKLKLADPALDQEAYDQLKYEMESKRSKLKEQQEADIEKIKEFVSHCGVNSDETDTTHKRWDFEKYVKTIVWDRMVYNYTATELIPTKDGKKLHHFYPVSAGSIKYVSQNDPQKQKETFSSLIAMREKAFDKRFDEKKPFKYVQVVRGQKVAAFTEDEMIFEAAQPTIDPEDNGYAPGELELLIQIVTAHLYAEAHNRNFFSQGLGTKGILHIKGDIPRQQLEAFKRQWFNQIINTRNAFRPPVIGMAEDVKWVTLAQTNQEMEFEKWMNYLIKIACAIYQIDPAEINFDISKAATASFGDQNNEQKIKNSKDKGLQPLLDYVENIINNHILRYWDKDLADKYKFKFVGFDAETRTQEIDRLDKETKVWKTINEARVEMGFPPIEDGDVIRDATYTQYKQMKMQQDQMTQGMGPDGQPIEGEQDGQVDEETTDTGDEIASFSKEIDEAVDQATKEMDQQAKEEADAEKASAKAESTKKSKTVIEYHYDSDEE